jgi:hypothetical protein
MRDLARIVAARRLAFALYLLAEALGVDDEGSSGNVSVCAMSVGG